MLWHQKMGSGVLLAWALHPKTSSSEKCQHSCNIVTPCQCSMDHLLEYGNENLFLLQSEHFFFNIFYFVEIFSISLPILLFVLIEVSKYNLNIFLMNSNYYILLLWLYFGSLSYFFSSSIVLLFSTLLVLFYHFTSYCLICYRWIKQIIKNIKNCSLYKIQLNPE